MTTSRKNSEGSVVASPLLDRRKRVLARAARRREEGGAIIFIVAMTLSLLAALGVYALTSTTSEMRTSGYSRQATQAHYVTEFASKATNDVISPENATFFDNQMTLNVSQPMDCDSAAPKATSSAVATEISKRCVKFSDRGMTDIWQITRGEAIDAFRTDAFGAPRDSQAVRLIPEFRSEITDPISNGVQPGFDLNNGKCSRKYTVTAVGTLREAGANGRILARETGRSRIVAGPFDCGG